MPMLTILSSGKKLNDIERLYAEPIIEASNIQKIKTIV